MLQDKSICQGITVIRGRNLMGAPTGFSVDSKGTFTATDLGPRDWNQDQRPAMGRTIKLADLAPGDLTRLAPGTWVDAEDATIVPAAIDAHIHSRDPGLTHKEDWTTIAAGAAKGGVVGVADMPNTIPPTLGRVSVLEKARIARDAGVDFRLLLGVGAKNLKSVGELLSDPELPICALKVFYGKTTGELMYDDLETLARHLPDDGKKLIVFHSEDQCQVDCNEALFKDQLQRSDPSGFAVHSQIRSSAAAHESTRTILEWARTTYRRPVHIAHISTPLEVELVAEYKSKGVRCTCEIAPHHLIFSTDDYPKLGAYGKMNPPLRSRAEVEALRVLLKSGAIDMFATDHAPHLRREKDSTVGRAPSGVPALEFYWPLILECARLSGLLEEDPALPLAAHRAAGVTSQELIYRMACETPAKLFGFGKRGKIIPGHTADFVVLSTKALAVNNQDVISKCGWTPYDQMTLPRGVLQTWWAGKRVWQA